jgi:hypothetical protein
MVNDSVYGLDFSAELLNRSYGHMNPNLKKSSHKMPTSHRMLTADGIQEIKAVHVHAHPLSFLQFLENVIHVLCVGLLLIS